MEGHPIHTITRIKLQALREQRDNLREAYDRIEAEAEATQDAADSCPDLPNAQDGDNDGEPDKMQRLLVILGSTIDLWRARHPMGAIVAARTDVARFFPCYPHELALSLLRGLGFDDRWVGLFERGSSGGGMRIQLTQRVQDDDVPF